jgi:hypothetical protein
MAVCALFKRCDLLTYVPLWLAGVRSTHGCVPVFEHQSTYVRTYVRTLLEYALEVRTYTCTCSNVNVALVRMIARAREHVLEHELECSSTDGHVDVRHVYDVQCTRVLVSDSPCASWRASTLVNVYVHVSTCPYTCTHSANGELVERAGAGAAAWPPTFCAHRLRPFEQAVCRRKTSSSVLYDTD